jgi:hypothetical protein
MFVSLPCAVFFLGGGIRAGFLAYRHRDQIHTTLERTSWFLRLFKRDGLVARRNQNDGYWRSWFWQVVPGSLV